MFFGIPVHSFVFVHTLITLVAIASGLVMLAGMLGNRRRDMTHNVFLLFSVLTAVTGFMIQIKPVTPAVTLGVLLSVVLVFALAGRYVFHMIGAWRWIYVVSAVTALYFNCFVLVVQSFLKVPALHALAPAGNEPPFAVAQGVVLIAFVVAGYLSLRRFHPAG